MLLYPIRLRLGVAMHTHNCRLQVKRSETHNTLQSQSVNKHHQQTITDCALFPTENSSPPILQQIASATMSAQQDNSPETDLTGKGKGKASPQDDVSMSDGEESDDDEESGIEDHVSWSLVLSNVVY